MSVAQSTKVSPELEPKPHISFSALSSYVRCPKQYQLGRVLELQGDPHLATAGGRAVHHATEAYDWLTL